MNFFFGINSSILTSKLTIPRFSNKKPTKKNYKIFQLKIKNKRWKINKLDDVELSEDFYKIDNSLIDNGSIFCLATEDEVQQFEQSNLSKLSDFSDYTTGSSFRANLQVSIENGGFSSYQSEYPFGMVTKTGSILSSISSLCNTSADENIVFLKNIYELPIQEEFRVFFVNLKTKRVLKKELVLTNYMNEIVIDKDLIKPEVFLFTDKYIGVPIFCSIKNKHISLEHTHPPHEYLLGSDKFKIVTELKRQFNEIII